MSISHSIADLFPCFEQPTQFRLVTLDESTRCLPDPKNSAVYADLLDRANRLRAALVTANLL
jgi:hypothetical protein